MKFTKLRNGVLRSADELGINYIENGNAELASPAPSLYSDAADVKPVDGQGGSVNTSTELNFSRSTSSPLRGSASWVFDKKSGNQQGKGGSFPFTIDVADKGKQVQITFDYSVLSGTYATGDVAVYIVHDPSGTPKVIQPSAFNIENVGIESLARLTFQTEYSSVLDYNLCFHVASTSASAYSLKFDNIQLGPQVVPLGAPVTDWVAFTPSWTTNAGSLPTVSTNQGWWRRNGDSMEIRVFRVYTAAGTGGGLHLLTVPNGQVIDLTGNKMNSTTGGTGTQGQVGSGSWYDDTLAATQGGISVSGFIWSSTQIGVVPNGQATTGINTLFGNNDRLAMTVSVPIVGWSSSTVVSSSANTRTVVTKLIRSTSATGINPNASYVKIPLNTVNIDTVGAADVANNQVVIKVPGKYNVSWSLGIGSTNVLASQYLSAVYKNGGAEAYGNTCTPAATTSFISSGSTDMELAVGDVLDLRLFGGGNNSVNTLSSFTGTGVSFSVSLIQGPSQIAMSEIIAAIYRNCSTTVAASGSLTTLNFADKVQDTHNAVTTGASWTFTAPAPGFYVIQGYSQATADSFTIGGNFVWDLTVNGVDQVIRLGRCEFYRTGTIAPNATLSGGVYLNAGGTLQIKAAHGESGTRTMVSGATFNQISVYRLGGVM